MISYFITNITNQNKIAIILDIINKSNMRGFLSPTSRTNCAYSDTFCSLTPKAGMQCIDDKCSTMGYSQMIQSPSQTKFYSFKKIKQDRIKQKNQQGKVVKQMVYKDKKRKI